MKLTKVQQQVLDEIINDINEAKKYDNYRDYYNNVECKNFRIKNYDECVEKYGQQYADTYKHYWEDQLNNIDIVYCSSATLKALEKAGYIEIIEDGRKYPDTVKLLKGGTE